MNFGFFFKLSPPFSRQSERRTRRCHFAQQQQKKELVFRFNGKKKKTIWKIKRHNSNSKPRGLLLFFFFFMFYEIDIPVVKATWGGRWRTARTGKSCVKPVATADLFNPAVREWSTQIGIHARGDNCLDFPTFCVLQPFGFGVGVSRRGKAGEMDSPLCGASVLLLSGSGGMQRSRNLGCTLPYAAHFFLHYFR